MKILLAVDGSPYTKKMLDYVTSNPSLFGPDHAYTVFTAQSPLPPHVRSTVGAQVVQDYYDDETRKVLEPTLRALKRGGIEAKGVWKPGHAGEAIAKFADGGKFDLLIMGSHGHGALSNLVMGSVTTKVLAHCGVPVLLVR